MPPTTPAAGATEDQVFDPLAELRKRYPGVSQEPDEKLYQHLSNPANFRSAFPEYEHLDDQTITTNMAKHSPTPNLPGGTPKLLEAVKAGKAPGAPTQPTQFEKDRTPGAQSGFWSHVGQSLSSMIPSPEEAGKSALKTLAFGPAAPIISGLESASGAVQEAKAARQRGHAAPYSAAAGASTLVGVNPERMEAAANKGDTAGVLGEAAVPTALAATPLITRGVSRVANIPAVEKGLSTVAKPFTSVAKRVAEPFGVGVEGESLLKKGISPYAKQTGYDAAVERATNDIVDYHKENPINSVKDLDEAIPEIQKKIMDKEIKPVVAKHAKEELAPERMARVQKAVEDSISPFTEEFDEAGAKGVKELAEKMGKARTVGDLIGGDRGGLLGYVNGKLESYFSKYPSARKSNLMANPDTAGWAAARGALREEVLGHLEDQGETGMGEARQRWGALEELSKATERRVNQADRVKPMSLPRILGLVGAPVTGGLSVVAGEVAHHLNKTDVLVRRGIQRMADEPRTVTPAKPISKRSAAPERTLTTGPGGRPPQVPETFRTEPIGSVTDATKLGIRGEGGTIGERKLLPAPKTPAGTTRPNPAPTESAPTPAKPFSAKGSQPEAMDTAATQTQPVRKAFKPEEVEEGKLLIRSVLDTMASGDRPGRYFNENAQGDFTPQREQRADKGVFAGGHWMGIKSMRDKLPWISEHPEWSPSMLERALNSGDGSALYEKAVRSAIEFNQREKMTPEEKVGVSDLRSKSWENVFGKKSAEAPQQGKLAFRAHDAGKTEVDLEAHAHATESEAEANKYALHRNQGIGQKVSKINIGNWKPEDFEEVEGPNGNKWFKFKRQPKPEEYE